MGYQRCLSSNRNHSRRYPSRTEETVDVSRVAGQNLIISAHNPYEQGIYDVGASDDR